MSHPQRHSANNTRRLSGYSRGEISRLSNPEDSHVKVAVRCRPMSDKEINEQYESIVEIESDQRIVVHDVSKSPGDLLGTKSDERRNLSHVFDFDIVFDGSATQKDVYDHACRPIVQSALQGYNGTIFAYGQTGTGKTFTMEGVSSRRKLHKTAVTASTAGDGSTATGRGDDSETKSKQNQSGASVREPASGSCASQEQESAGIIPRTFDQIFEHIARHPDIQFLIRASYLEIYQEEIRDLLKRDKNMKLELHERTDIGVYVKDLTSFVCKSIHEIERVMRVGNQNRIVGATDMNEHSSRSHAIFMITIEQQQQSSVTPADTLQQPSSITRDTNCASKKRVIKVGKLNLVDLAGSERQRKTNSLGQRQKESIKINSSLSALGNVINSLVKIQISQEKQRLSNNNSATPHKPTATTHTPYRDSKLTRLLQDSLGGNAKTLMIANIGPASYNYDETINTLNYASRARCIKNKPRLNEDPKDALLRELQLEIDSLRAKLAEGISASTKKVVANAAKEAGNASSKHRRSEDVSAAGAHKLPQSQSQAPLTVSSIMSVQSEPKEQNINNTIAKQDIDTDESQLQIEREFIELKQKLSSLESKLLNSDRGTLIMAAPQDASAAAAAATATLASPATSTMSGGAAMVDQNLLQGYTKEQELELKKRQVELASQAGREQAIRDELERRSAAEMLAKESFNSIQQEVDAKRRLIRQILLKIKSIRNEIDDSQEAYRLELEELDQLQYVLQKELKLKCLIMDNFIPNIHVDQLLSRIVYDERRNICSIEPLDLPLDYCNYGMNISSASTRIDANLSHYQHQNYNYSDYWRPTYDSIRPKSEFERISEAIYPSNIRYKYQDLIEPKLDLPLRESRRRLNLSGHQSATDQSEVANDDDGGVGDSKITDQETTRFQALIDKALNQREPNIVI